jgi:hypothetical protein
MSGYVRHPSEAECTNQILRRNQVYESISDVNPSLGLKLSSNAPSLTSGNCKTRLESRPEKSSTWGDLNMGRFGHGEF